MRLLSLPRSTIDKPERGTFPAEPTGTPLRGPLTVVDEATGLPAIIVTRLEDDGGLRRLLREYDAAGPHSSGRSRRAGFSYRSETFGFGPRNPLRRRYGCAESALARTEPEVNSALAALAHQAGTLLEDADDEAWARQAAHAATVRPEWRIANGLWTSGIINMTASLPYHRDGNNIARSWSAMLCLRRGIRGGHLHIPEYDVTLAIEDRSIIFFEGSNLWHGVTPLHPADPDGYRYTVVLYAVAGMCDCTDPGTEIKRAQIERSTAEERIAAALTTTDDELETVELRGLRFLCRRDSSDQKALAEVVGRQSYLKHGIAIRPGERWVDLGANIGSFAVQAAAAGAIVTAYEPDPDSAALARANGQLNGVAFDLHEAAIGIEAGTATLYVNGARRNYWRNSLVKPWRGGTERTVDVIPWTEAIPDGCNVKMDIEGSEFAILEAIDFDRLGDLVFEWSFDIDRSIPRFAAVVARLRQSYPSVWYGKFDEAQPEWPASWFPACRTVYCTRGPQ